MPNQSQSKRERNSREKSNNEQNSRKNSTKKPNKRERATGPKETMPIKKRWRLLRQRLFNMVSVGVVNDPINQFYDIISTGALLINLVAAIMDTFDGLHSQYGDEFKMIEAITVAFFAVDYVLRLLTAKELHPKLSEKDALIKYIFSFSGIIDLLSFLPYYLPFFFPGGVVAFRMIRVVRIMRLFRINAYYDSLNVIGEVLVGKSQQLASSVFIILVLMVASSLCMYSVEHEAQPEVFENAFSGIWWATSTLLTVGYGDIYPITMAGKALGIFIAFLGVGMVAIPTGIISAGFVEQYSRLKRLGEYVESGVNFIELKIQRGDVWCGKKIQELGVPRGAIIAVILRGDMTMIPRGDTVLEPNDILVLGAETRSEEHPIELKEMMLGHEHPWNGERIKDLDISRQSLVVMIRRRGRMQIPNGDMVLAENDTVYLYTKLNKKALGE